ncbi:MAG: response regulator [Prevotella sp.]
MKSYMRLLLLVWILLVIQPITLCPAFADNKTQIETWIEGYETTRDKAKVANLIFKQLYADEFTDHAINFNAQSHPDSIDKLVWYWAGEYYYDRQDYQRARDYALKALPLCTDHQTRSDCQSLLSIIYFRQGDYTQALDYAMRSLETDKLMGDKSRISSSLNTIAGIYLASKQPAKGEKYILEAIRNSTAAADTTRMAIQYGMASEIYHGMEQHHKSLIFARKAFEIDSLRGNQGKTGIRLSQMATAQMALGQTAEAERSLRRAIPLLQETGQQTSLGICHNQMGTLLCHRGLWREAEASFRAALAIFTDKQDPYNESKSRYGLYQTLRRSHPEEALVHLERYAGLKDTLYHKDMQDALQGYDAKFRNEELSTQNEQARLRQRIIIATSLSVVAVLVVVIVILLYRYLLRKKRNMLQKELIQSKERFFTGITHEFRTPLTIIRAAAQHIRDHTAEETDLHANAEDIIRHQDGLLSLINQILDVAKLSANDTVATPPVKHGDIVGFVSMICQSYTAYAADKGITLVYAPQEEAVETDFIPDYINKTMQNLLANAIKFSPAGSEVLVSSRIESHSLRIYVSDQGIGMSPEEKACIFRPFYRADTACNSVGTGIGLPLAKLAVEAMHGTIEVHSAPGMGSTFVVTLPLAEAETTRPAVTEADWDSTCTLLPAAPMPEDDTPDDDTDTIRILMAEDTPEVADYIRRQLNPQYRFFFASNGEEALQKANELVPDLVITDIMMPKMDGVELCSRIRSSELLCHIPVIMVTAKVTHEDRMRGLAAGADAYLEKPFHADELHLRVEKLLEQRQLLRERFSATITEEAPAEEAEISEQDRAFINRFTDATHKHIRQGKIDYDALAYDLCVSRAQLNRKLKAITGYTTTEYILLIRLTYARQLLDTTDMPIADIALRCGMDNASYFGSLFKKNVGMTPLQYRNKNKNG